MELSGSAGICKAPHSIPRPPTTKTKKGILSRAEESASSHAGSLALSLVQKPLDQSSLG